MDHTTAVSQNFLEDFVATCTCGWESEGYDTWVQAQGAADRHVALRL